MLNCFFPLSNFINHYQYSIILSVGLLFFAYYYLRLVFTKYYKTTAGLHLASGLAMVCFGSVANIYQRVRYTCVLDDLSFFGFVYFNIFDIILVIGASIMVVTLWMESSNE